RQRQMCIRDSFLNRVVDLLIVIGNGSAEVVHGNYDTYELLRAAREAAAKTNIKAKPPENQAARPAPPAKPKKPKRRFPFRKVEELEADIAATEAQIQQAEAALASPELYRDAAKLKETMRLFEDAKARLQQLYEHWEEAIELN
ncbi:MAG: ABC transporter C-terminal domain-containing protein, partial [Gemmataceae bacterium]|nr:ABC transporter C-terminal domain-containing protein [Gemmataceae bacterium]